MLLTVEINLFVTFWNVFYFMVAIYLINLLEYVLDQSILIFLFHFVYILNKIEYFSVLFTYLSILLIVLYAIKRFIFMVIRL